MRFNDTYDAIYGADSTTQAGRDASIDLGMSSQRFKDLHLSGTGYFGTSVGIGTTSPSTTLELSNASTAPILRLSNENNSITAGADLGVIEFYSGDDSGGGNAVKASISAIQPTTTPVSSELVFKTSLSSGSLTTAMTIDSSQRVGIGTDSPSNPLTVVGADSMAIDDYIVHYGDSNTKIGFPSNDKFKIRVAGSDIATVTSTGLGIGTTSPVSLLTVGSVSATNNYSVARENAVITGTDVTVSATQAGMLDILSTSLAGSGKSASLTFSQNTSQFVAGYDKVLGAIDVELTSTGNLSADSAMKFYTSSGSTSSTLSERMRLDASGNLLVGTTSQISAGKITVSGGTAASGITATTDATAGYAAASFQSNS